MMSNFKQKAEEWAGEVLSKAPKTFYEEAACQFQEFMFLGSLLFDNEGNWIPRL
jgi:hypothetical protein